MGSTPGGSFVEAAAEMVGGRCVVALWCSSSAALDVVVVDLRHDSEHITILSRLVEHTHNIQQIHEHENSRRKMLVSILLPSACTHTHTHTHTHTRKLGERSKSTNFTCRADTSTHVHLKSWRGGGVCL